MMNRSRHVAAFVALFCLSTALLGQNRLVVASGPFDDQLVTIDAATGTLHGIQTLTSTAGTVQGVNGMAVDPTNGTIYAIVKIAAMSNRQLATLDRCSGILTVVGNMGDSFAAITFDSAGQLYGVTGDGANTPETLYTINKATAVGTLLTALGAGTDGEAIAFNPNDGLIYHASGLSTRIFESIDPVTLTITNIPLTGFNTSEVFGLVWDQLSNGFLVADIGIRFSHLTTGGVISFLYDDSLLINNCRGMVIVNDLAGTGDDLDITFQRNGGAIQTGFGLCRTQPVLPGDAVVIGHNSPMGNLAFAGPFVAYGSFITTGVIVPSPLAGLHVDLANGVLIFGGNVGGLPLLLPVAGFSYGFVTPPVGLAGFSFVAQCIVQSGAALNHIYAASDALELQFH